MSYLSRLIEQHHTDLLNQLSECYSEVISRMQRYHQSHIEFCGQIVELVDKKEKELVETQQRELKEIEKQHDREINDQHTVALKMSYFKDYDRRVHDLENEIRILNKKLELAEKKPIKEVKPPETKSTPEAESEAKDPVKQKPTEEEEANKEDKEEGAMGEPRSRSALFPQKEGAMGEPRSQSGALFPQSRKKIKWKGEIYYYCPKTLNVFQTDTSEEVIGKKEEKRLVLK